MEKWLRSMHIPYLSQEPLARHTTFKVGGPAQWFVVPDNCEVFCSVVAHAYTNGIPCHVIGRGSNLLVDDKGVDGVVVSTEKLNKIEIIGQYIVAESGCGLIELCTFAQRNGRGGLAGFYGIPGSVGGAIYMNSGAMEIDISSVLSSVRIFDAKRKKVFSTAPEELHFSYRTSVFQNEPAWYILGAIFKTDKAIPEEVLSQMRLILQKRKETQPISSLSAGSFFMRTLGGVSASWLIDSAGLKGKRRGGAQISNKHAGFLINVGQATASDIRLLAHEITELVYQKTGVTLRPEVIFWP